jgi:DNA-directed RNA polymerase specialized sigma24 family protein
MNQFATTRWSVVVSAQAGSSTESDAALATLCQTYWFPVYAFVRRQGHDPESAKDLTQEFFAQLLEKQYLDSADRERGRFRTFLLTILQRFLTKQRDRERALKRGGDRRQLSLDWAHGERRLQYEPASTWTPEKIFERQWARSWPRSARNTRPRIN